MLISKVLYDWHGVKRMKSLKEREGKRDKRTEMKCTSESSMLEEFMLAITSVHLT